LPKEAKFLWKKKLSNQGLGGIAATSEIVIVSDRDLLDSTDIFRGLKADSGEELWTVRYLAKGNLDYGNSPRATPLIAGDLAYLYGAFGHLHCVELKTGKIVWKKEIRKEFGADGPMTWGMASSPLIAQGKLILNPGGPAAALVALDPKSGEVLWKTPGQPAAFGSFLFTKLGGKEQLVGYDQISLGGWDAATGKRLWTLTPENDHDFNVATPVVWKESLILSTENNSTRLHGFDQSGSIQPKPIATYEPMAPDMHTPIVVGNRLFGVATKLHCLNLEGNLKPLWTSADEAFSEYATIIASDDKLLITAQNGQLLLIDATADTFKLLSRLTVFPDESGVYAHPALVGKRLFLRSSTHVVCLELNP
jgi:outer membrane protein assembly factor BamB